MFLFWIGSLCAAQLYWIALCGETLAVFFVFLSNGMPVAIYSLYIRNIMTGLHLHLQCLCKWTLGPMHGFLL
jgi:hypothetical protein